MELSGTTAIITGSAVGVGRETALELAKRGANVVVNYSRSEDDAKETASRVEALGAKVLLVRADVSDDAQVRSMVQQTLDAFGSLHVLVNNAGTTAFVPFHDLEGLSSDDWDRILAVNLKGPFFCSRAVAAPMRSTGNGAIVNVASVAGTRAVGSSIAYAASKAGLINMTIALARVLAPEIRVNCVAPGFIDTRWLKQGLGEGYEGAKRFYGEQTPLKRVASPGDVAQVVLSLIEGADFVTGETITVDGGNTIRG
jgi:3-oxoacyl-[acyl-carrier protein] reductase